MSETATQVAMREMMRVDLRRKRAESLMAAIVNEIGYLVYEDDRPELYDKLFDLFHRMGVDVLTDDDRAAIGLPRRDDYGWTAAEVAALELKRLKLLTRPLALPLSP